ncbi:hypothetical protein M758_6G146000 [Ceratodon purpureus]|nr:hypothetical protein M758_6G146000 [Ceratodon purpureus]
MAMATPMAHLLLGASRAHGHAALPCVPALRSPLQRSCQFSLLSISPRIDVHSLGASLLLRPTLCRSSSKPRAPLSTEPPVPEPEQEPGWPNLEPWDVPWDGTTTAVGMLSWLFSFVVTGLAVSVVAAQLGIGRRQGLDLDEQATFILFNQLTQTVAGLGSLSLVLGRYKPLPPQLFSYDFSEPFNLRRGWILYGGLGLLGATASVVAASSLVVNLTGQPPPREEADALLQLLPIIGASPGSTAALVFVTGVLAPLLEETVFRGFFLTSLTKWVPTPVAIVVSAFAFAGAHLTPGEFPQLAALGIVLGLTYAQTRTLVTPILIHSLWNSGVIVILTVLRLQGYDIKELL